MVIASDTLRMAGSGSEESSVFFTRTAFTPNPMRKAITERTFSNAWKFQERQVCPEKLIPKVTQKLLRFTLKKSNYAKFCRWTIKVAYESRIIGNSERELDFLAKILSKKKCAPKLDAHPMVANP